MRAREVHDHAHGGHRHVIGNVPSAAAATGFRGDRTRSSRLDVERWRPNAGAYARSRAQCRRPRPQWSRRARHSAYMARSLHGSESPCETPAVTQHLERMLRHVVRDTFDEDVEAVWHTDGARNVSRVTLSAEHGAGRRTVEISASTTGLFQIDIRDLDVGAILIEDDDDSYMESIVRELALVARAYLSGEGRVRQRRGMLRTRSVMAITVNGNEWTLGRSTCSVHYPQDPSAQGTHH